MRGLREVFAFTLKQQFKIKSVKVLTIVVALVLLIVPAASMTIIELNRSPEEPLPEPPAYEDDYSAKGISTVYLYTDNSSGEIPSIPAGTPIYGCEGVKFVRCNTYAEAAGAAKGRSDALIVTVRLSKAHNCYEVTGIVPEDSNASGDPGYFEVIYSKASYVAECVNEAFRKLLVESLNISPEVSSSLEKPLYMQYSSPEETGEMSPEEALNRELSEMITMFMPYLNIMLIYFLVLYYGQSVANSVILEKSSKLMDTFLISVEPKAMIFGKVLATWVAALSQFLLWVFAGIAGFSIGSWAVRLINPASPMGILKLFQLLRMATRLFSLPNVLVAILLIIGGFFLYCTMAAIAGSFASKPEELSSTITVFTLTLVISMFITLKTGFIDRDMGQGAAWFDFVPFTATLITPSRMLLGYIDLTTGLLSLAVTAALSVLFILIAGKAYTMMSLYKGKVPSIKEIAAMIRA